MAQPRTTPASDGTRPPRPPRAKRAKPTGPRRTPVPAAARSKDPDLIVLRKQLLETVAGHYPQADLTPVGAAFDLAVEAHEGARRATGEPYVTHPIASAQITAELGIDPIAVQAALLHDVPEDTEYDLSDLEERFGAEVAHMVDGVTKLSKFSTHSHEQQQAENIRKMLLAMAEDIRVVLIKLADRLHNMRTLYALASEKQVRIARQTMEIYAPLAERLGIWQIK
jgi:GTP pyrophosphokinase